MQLAPPSGSSVTTVSSVSLSVSSLTVSRKVRSVSTVTAAALNVAVALDASVNVTVGPPVWVQL